MTVPRRCLAINTPGCGFRGRGRSVVERASPLSTSPCRHPRLTGRHRACRDVASARTIDRQFESCRGSDRTSCRPSPLSLLSGISTATPYHYIHTYYILYLISGRLTLQYIYIYIIMFAHTQSGTACQVRWHLLIPALKTTTGHVVSKPGHLTVIHYQANRQV